MGDAAEKPGAPEPTPAPKPEGQTPSSEPASEPSSERGLGDLRRDFSAHAARPGTTEERLGAERDARAVLSRFAQADVRARRVYGGDHIEVLLGEGRTSIRAYQLGEEELDQAKTVFVPPTGYSSLLQSTSHIAVVLLAGTPGSGKYAVARRLLLDSGHTTLQRLESGADLSRLDGESLEEGHGYLLPDLPARSGTDFLSGFELQRLNATIGKRHCRLVITVSDGTPPTNPELDKHTFTVGPSPQPHAVFEAHLDWWHGPARKTRTRQLLECPEILSLVSGNGAPVPSLARVAYIAQLLSEISAPATEAARHVTGRLASSDTQAFETWFNGLADLPTQCLAVSTAIFGGEAYETAAALATSLCRRMQPPESIDNPDRPRNEAIIATTAIRLGQLHASLVTAEVSTRHGGAPGKVVRYRDPASPARVLQNVWEQYDRFPEHLPGWLKECAGHELATVRAKAAVAVGFLAEFAFDALYSEVLRPWAVSRLPQLRTAAATALCTAAQSPDLADTVRNLVRAWAAEGERRELRATAARAWAALLCPGEENGGEAVTLLNELAGTTDPEVVEAICVSSTEYLAMPDRHHERNALALIRHWTELRDPRHRTVGELAFLFAAADLVEELPDSAGRVPTRRWPGLLALSARDPMRQRDVAVLWETVLLSPVLYQDACEVLTEWARAIDQDPAGRRALGRLLRTAASAPRSWNLIRRSVTTWCAPDSRAADTARLVLSYLDDKDTAP